MTLEQLLNKKIKIWKGLEKSRGCHPNVAENMVKDLEEILYFVQRNRSVLNDNIHNAFEEFMEKNGWMYKRANDVIFRKFESAILKYLNPIQDLEYKK